MDLIHVAVYYGTTSIILPVIRYDFMLIIFIFLLELYLVTIVLVSHRN